MAICVGTLCVTTPKNDTVYFRIDPTLARSRFYTVRQVRHLARTSRAGSVVEDCVCTSTTHSCGTKTVIRHRPCTIVYQLETVNFKSNRYISKATEKSSNTRTVFLIVFSATSTMGKHLQTVAAMACMKSLLMVFNFVFWITGIIILAIGIWMQVELYKYFELSTEFPGTAPYVLIGTGALIIVIGSLACCCTIKGQPALLYMYGAFLAVIFVLELGAGVSIFAYRSKLADGFNQGLNESMINYQNGPKEKTAAFDLMQTTLQCCGVRGPNDWGNLHPPFPVPLSCCIHENCDVAEDDAIYSQGCYDKVIEFLDSIIGIVAGSAVGITFFPLVGLILSCCLANSINKAKYEQMA